MGEIIFVVEESLAASCNNSKPRSYQGTLQAVVADVSAQLDIPRDELVRKLFG